MIKVLIRDKHEKCSVTVLLSYTMSIVYVLAIHPLLDGTLGGPTAFSLSQLLILGRATLSQGSDCDVRCLSE